MKWGGGGRREKGTESMDTNEWRVSVSPDMMQHGLVYILRGHWWCRDVATAAVHSARS